MRVFLGRRLGSAESRSGTNRADDRLMIREIFARSTISAPISRHLTGCRGQRDDSNAPRRPTRHTHDARARPQRPATGSAALPRLPRLLTRRCPRAPRSSKSIRSVRHPPRAIRWITSLVAGRARSRTWRVFTPRARRRPPRGARGGSRVERVGHPLPEPLESTSRGRAARTRAIGAPAPRDPHPDVARAPRSTQFPAGRSVPPPRDPRLRDDARSRVPILTQPRPPEPSAPLTQISARRKRSASGRSTPTASRCVRRTFKSPPDTHELYLSSPPAPRPLPPPSAPRASF